MKYIKSDFLHENLHLRQLPTNSVETKNKLTCLLENAQKRNPNYARDSVINKKPSKRNKRLVKIYWAFIRKEVA